MVGVILGESRPFSQSPGSLASDLPALEPAFGPGGLLFRLEQQRLHSTHKFQRDWTGRKQWTVRHDGRAIFIVEVAEVDFREKEGADFHVCLNVEAM